MGRPESKRARKKRLKECKERKAGYLADMDANPADPRHGTRKGYTYGCRCVDCVEAQRRWWNARGKAMRWNRWIKEGRVPRKRVSTLEELRADPEHPLHGTVNAYWKGCHCERCRAAQRDYFRVRRGSKPREESQAAKDAREIAEGLKAYRQWLALGGTPESWREFQEITLEC